MPLPAAPKSPDPATAAAPAAPPLAIVAAKAVCAAVAATPPAAAVATAVVAAAPATAACAAVCPTIVPKAPDSPLIRAFPTPGKINIIAIWPTIPILFINLPKLIKVFLALLAA